MILFLTSFGRYVFIVLLAHWKFQEDSDIINFVHSYIPKTKNNASNIFFNI